MGKYQRISKAEKKNLKLWADGVRSEVVLAKHVEPYAHAWKQSQDCECAYWLQVCREYHSVFHWRTPDDVEPDLASLNLPYDPTTPVVEEDLSPEDAKVKSGRINAINAVRLLYACVRRVTDASHYNQRIRRWLKYRSNKNSTLKRYKDSQMSDPSYHALFSRLLGKTSNRPRALQAWQQFGQSRKKEMAPLLAKAWSDEVYTIERRRRVAAGETLDEYEDETPPDQPMKKLPRMPMNFRQRFLTDEHAKLSAEEKEQITADIAATKAKAMEKYLKTKEAEVSTLPQDRQA
jgi:hypothetical protein